MSHTARTIITVAAFLATIATGWHTAANAAPRDDWAFWVHTSECALDVVPSGAPLEVTVDDGPTVTIEAPQTIHVDGPATVVVGHRTAKQYDSRTYEVPACPTTTVPPDTTTTTTTPPDTTTPPTTPPETTDTTSTTTTVPVTTSSSTTVPSTAPPTTSTTLSVVTTSVPPSTTTPTVEIYCTGVTLGLEAGTWTVRIGDETHEGFTVDEARLVTFSAPLPPYRLVVAAGDTVFIDTTVTAEHVDDWPCDESVAPPSGDDSSSTGELPLTGPSDVLLALGVIGTLMVIGGGTLLLSRAGKE